MWVSNPSSLSPPSWLYAHMIIQINEVEMKAKADLNVSINPVSSFIPCPSKVSEREAKGERALALSKASAQRGVKTFYQSSMHGPAKWPYLTD